MKFSKFEILVRNIGGEWASCKVQFKQTPTRYIATISDKAIVVYHLVGLWHWINTPQQW